MNKILPIVIAVVFGGVVVFGAFKVLQSFSSPEEKNTESSTGSSKSNPKTETALRELRVEEKPFVSLVPRVDGRELQMTISKIPQDVEVVEYEMVYKVASGITQGVPGSVKPKGQTKIERDLLLGTCSSGKCRYDEGVEDGSFTLRLRNSDGKLIAKLETPFHLQKGGKSLNLPNGSFELTSSNIASSAYYLTMGTFGLPGDFPGKTMGQPYGVFTKGQTSVSGEVDIEGEGSSYIWNGSKWTELKGNKSTSLGVFVKASSE